MKGIVFYLLLFIPCAMYAQRPTNPTVPTEGIPGNDNGANNLSQFGGRFGGRNQSTAKDTLEKRDKYEDSITITYKYFNDPKVFKMDTAIDDFFNRIPLPASYRTLGNFGNAAQSLIWTPIMKAGFDAGFHAFDIYRFTTENTKLFQTSKPFTEIDYVIGRNIEQYMNVFHTQNIKPNINIVAQYRLVNSLGHMKNQQTNNNNYRFAINYASKKKRYNAQFVVVGNRLQSAENGGVRAGVDYKNNETYIDRKNIPVYIGDSLTGNRSFFSTAIAAGNKYAEANVLFRHSYDIGRKDSLVTDSINYEVFYPKLRLQHTLSIQNNRYLFIDGDVDSAYYKNNYNIDVNRRSNTGGFFFKDRWQVLENDFSIYQFPDKKNTQQYIQAGINFQQITGYFDSISNITRPLFTNKETISNLMIHGRYRNISKNKKWDIDALADLYPLGWNAGDYKWALKLKSLVSKKIGSFEILAENSNQKPAYIFYNKSNYTRGASDNYNKQNILHLEFAFDNAPLKLSAAAHLYTVSNYTYYSTFIKTAQSNVFNVLQIILDKKLKLSRRHWVLYSQWALQQRIGNADLFLPNIFTRNRIAYETRVKKMTLTTGIDIKYFTPYKIQKYSPVGGQFVWDANAKTNTNLPEIAAYLNFKIRGFSAFLRAENLNTVRVSNNNGFTFNFTNNNLFNENYLTPGLNIRIGIFWEFLN